MSNKMKNKITFVIVGLVAAIVLASTASASAATWTQKADMPTPRDARNNSVQTVISPGISRANADYIISNVVKILTLFERAVG
jgi:multidrug resistance efflux pump